MSNTVRKTTNRIHKLLILFLFQVQANEAETLSNEVVNDMNHKVNTKLLIFHLTVLSCDLGRSIGQKFADKAQKKSCSGFIVGKENVFSQTLPWHTEKLRFANLIFDQLPKALLLFKASTQLT